MHTEAYLIHAHFFLVVCPLLTEVSSDIFAHYCNIVFLTTSFAAGGLNQKNLRRVAFSSLLKIGRVNCIREFVSEITWRRVPRTSLCTHV
jgi:hypothetical protein